MLFKFVQQFTVQKLLFTLSIEIRKIFFPNMFISDKKWEIRCSKVKKLSTKIHYSLRESTKNRSKSAFLTRFPKKIVLKNFILCTNVAMCF